MKLHLSLREVKLPFKTPVSISREIKTHQDMLIVKLTNEDGLAGLGEAPSFRVYGASISRMRASLEALTEQIGETHFSAPEELWDFSRNKLEGQNFALAALDIAAHDVFAKAQNITVRSFWAPQAQKEIYSSISVGIDEKATMISSFEAKVGWPSYKIKIGFDGDVDLLKRLRSLTPVPFRVDANTCWTLPEALRKVPDLEVLQIECLEQPLPADAWVEMKELAKRCSVPLYADESFKSIEDLSRCAEVFSGVNVKILKCGGFTPARLIISEAKRLGLKVMLGCMPESSLGISALAQMAPLADLVDADSALLFSKDLGRGVTLEKGRLIFSEGPGLGFVEF